MMRPPLNVQSCSGLPTSKCSKWIFSDETEDRVIFEFAQQRNDKAKMELYQGNTNKTQTRIKDEMLRQTEEVPWTSMASTYILMLPENAGLSW